MSLAQIKRRVASSTVRDARSHLGLTDSEIGRAAGADRRTVQRWLSQESTPATEHQEGLEQLRELMHLARKLFRSPEAAQEWLHSPVPILRGRTPASLIQEGRIDEVTEALATAASGAHV